MYMLHITHGNIVIYTLSPYMDSLRVNLDMGKAAYGWMIMKDKNLPGTVVRTSTIPEELGRLVYLLTDKTGKCPKRCKYVAFINFSRMRMKLSRKAVFF